MMCCTNSTSPPQHVLHMQGHSLCPIHFSRTMFTFAAPLRHIRCTNNLQYSNPAPYSLWLHDVHLSCTTLAHLLYELCTSSISILHKIHLSCACSPFLPICFTQVFLFFFDFTAFSKCASIVGRGVAYMNLNCTSYSALTLHNLSIEPYCH